MTQTAKKRQDYLTWMTGNVSHQVTTQLVDIGHVVNGIVISGCDVINGPKSMYEIFMDTWNTFHSDDAPYARVSGQILLLWIAQTQYI